MRQFFRNVALWMFFVFFAWPILYWVAGVRYRRKHLVPMGPCLIVANHNSHLDASLLMTLFPLRRLPHVHPVAAADYFGETWLKRTMAMLFMNAIPIERHPPRGTDPLQPMVDALKQGESLILFPEGSRGKAGVVAPFRAGVGRLARRVPGLLIVPVYLSGPERIWPRGEYVPVPIAVDAIVGKPRSYDPTMEAKEIADEIREAVLSLAPPPPPVPTARPAPPLRVAITGVDSAFVHEIFRRVVEGLAGLGKVFGVSEPVLEADAEGVREVVGPIPFTRARAFLGPMAWLFRTGGRFKGERFVKMIEQAQLNEALSQSRGANFVVSDGNALVDLLTWTEAAPRWREDQTNERNRTMQYLSGDRKIPMRRWLRWIRRSPEVWLVNTFDLAHPPVPEVLVHLKYPVGGVMQRIRQQGRPLRRFENEPFLQQLQDAFHTVGESIAKRRSTVFLEYDLGATTLDAVADAVIAACRDRLEQTASSQSQSQSQSQQEQEFKPKSGSEPTAPDAILRGTDAAKSEAEESEASGAQPAAAETGKTESSAGEDVS